MWEPFSEPARHAIVRAQEVAQLFGSSHIGTEHMTFALAELDDAVGEALTHAVDRDAIRERLGGASSSPPTEMVFTSNAKRSIELAFENARRLNHNYIGTAHIALGILGSDDPPPLQPHADLRALRASLDLAAQHARPPGTESKWRQTAGEPHPAGASVVAALSYYPELCKPETRITISIAPPDAPELSWTWTNEPKPKR